MIRLSGEVAITAMPIGSVTLRVEPQISGVAVTV